MFKTDKPVPYPADPNQPVWNYEQGTELRDPSMKEVADYYARLVSWYTQGGFTDEFGKRHESGHHYKIDYWEVLNEVDGEHHMSPQFYTRALRRHGGGHAARSTPKSNSWERHWVAPPSSRISSNIS